jgi:hypothetical protein
MKIALIFQAPQGATTMDGAVNTIDSSETGLIPNVEDYVFMGGISRKVIARAFTFSDSGVR